MPTRAPRACTTPFCPNLQPCAVHKRKAYDIERGSAHQRGYTARWARYAKLFLQRNPLCAEHEREGRIMLASLVDHIIPHRGNYELFWDVSNHQSLCASCHGVKSRSERLTE